ncbi:allantoinase AllB [Pseudoclavibacter sp. VKM Ac-2888]|uniref:allantoinase AllB n=1 Tax=Pseudoclavibacter sp. VKM Ac-2888 TaxID=2783830 RepID=UPI00188AD09D|nr:allantoinase AllB [Pseudoclavibacter sp. VKM Ac-2888]MBF4552144.1 allantoinase AllB [Pseudoclavibacter sp. VKM Ac-2888]
MRISARRVFLGGGFSPATVSVSDGTIAAIAPFDDDADVVLPDTQVLLPGLVDTHVHLNEPGRTHWEGFATGTAAAAAGGVTTVVDMPLNSLPVTTSVEALDAKRAATSGQLAVDLAYWGGVVPQNLGSLRPLLAAGAVGVKCFLAPSGIDEFDHLSFPELEQALEELAEVDGLLIAHAELEAHLSEASGPVFSDFVASRPPVAEVEAIRAVIAAARRTGARAHIVHVSAAEALDLVRAAKADGVRITIETCPHYLSLRAEEVPDGDGRFKCCPPIRDTANQDALWAGVLDGTIDAIVSDHSPATLELKAGPDLGTAWGGIAGVQTGLTAVWTEARRRGIPLEAILPLFTTGPAALVRLEDRGLITVGAPAHFAVFEPDLEHTLEENTLEYRTKISPWHGARMHGLVDSTYLHGELIYTRAAGLTSRLGREVLAAANPARLDLDEEQAA